MKLVNFTTTNGQTIAINPDRIESITPFEGKTIIKLTGSIKAIIVTECFNTAQSLLS